MLLFFLFLRCFLLFTDITLPTRLRVGFLGCFKASSGVWLDFLGLKTLMPCLAQFLQTISRLRWRSLESCLSFNQALTTWLTSNCTHLLKFIRSFSVSGSATLFLKTCSRLTGPSCSLKTNSWIVFLCWVICTVCKCSISRLSFSSRRFLPLALILSEMEMSRSSFSSKSSLGRLWFERKILRVDSSTSSGIFGCAGNSKLRNVESAFSAERLRRRFLVGILLFNWSRNENDAIMLIEIWNSILEYLILTGHSTILMNF